MRLISAGSLVRAQSGPAFAWSIAKSQSCHVRVERSRADRQTLWSIVQGYGLADHPHFRHFPIRERPLKTGNRQRAPDRLQGIVRAPETPVRMPGFERALVAKPGDR